MFTFADYAFWTAETIGYLLVLICSILSGKGKRWWSISTYCSTQVATNAALFIMCYQQAWSCYFYTLWTSSIVLLLLKLTVLFQIVISGLFSYKTAPASLRAAFGLSACTCSILAFAVGIRGNALGSGLPSFVLLANRAVSMSVVSIFAVFAVFSAILELKLDRQPLLVDTGLTLMASNDLLCFLGEITFTKHVLTIYRIQSAVDLVAIAAWCAAFIFSSDRDNTTSKARSEMLQIARAEIIQINPAKHRGTR